MLNPNASVDCVFMDLDGSTITEQGELPPDLRDLIGANQTVNWVIVTGRGYASASKTPIASAVSASTPHVFDGGATIMDLSGRLHKQSCLSQDELDAFFASIDTTQSDYIYAGVDAGGGLCWFAPDYTSRSIPTLKHTGDILEYQTWLRGREISKISVRQRTGGKVVLQVHHAINGNNIDVTAVGVDKAFGARDILRMLGGRPERAAFIFNDENDLALVRAPFFEAMTTIKVGDLLPDVDADICVPSPYDVTKALGPLLAV
jgi:hydroxymethylpyrimidine pyrophosphatase-like HAD family hydrolase